MLWEASYYIGREIGRAHTQGQYEAELIRKRIRGGISGLVHFWRAVIRAEAQGALFGEARAEGERMPRRTTLPLNLCRGDLACMVKQDAGLGLLVES